MIVCACACLGARERSERVARAAQPTSPALPPTCIKTSTRTTAIGIFGTFFSNFSMAIFCLVQLSLA